MQAAYSLCQRDLLKLMRLKWVCTRIPVYPKKYQKLQFNGRKLWYSVGVSHFQTNPNGGFHKWGFPKITHLTGILPYKPSIMGYRPFLETRKWTLGSRMTAMSATSTQLVQAKEHLERLGIGSQWGHCGLHDTDLAMASMAYMANQWWSYGDGLKDKNYTETTCRNYAKPRAR